MDRMTERRRDRRIPLGCKVGIKLPIPRRPLSAPASILQRRRPDHPVHPRAADGRSLRDRRAAARHGWPVPAAARAGACAAAHGLEQAGLYEMGVEIVDIIK